MFLKFPYQLLVNVIDFLVPENDWTGDQGNDPFFLDGNFPATLWSD